MTRIQFVQSVGIAACLCLLVAGCEGEVAEGDLCANVDCGEHGTCVNENGTARCTCNAGYHPQGLSCVPDNGECVDNDADGYGVDCEAGTDCDDGDSAVYQEQPGYTDADADGYGAGPVQQVCSGASLPSGYAAQAGDCDDNDAGHWNDCTGCTDADTDGYGTGCPSGADCDDDDKDNWISCATCVDGDGDTWFDGCDAYTTRNGPDCNDSLSDHWNDCGSCQDNDGDGYGSDCDLGTDCDDNDADHWDDCPGCTDADADGYGAGCPSGADCDDDDKDNWISCATCADGDGDTWFDGCDAYTTRNGPDCNDSSPDHWSDCTTCQDNDGDGYGTGCDLGADCNDADETTFDNCTNYALLTWEAPTTNEDGTPLTDLAGYRVYYGTVSGSYPTDIWVGNVITYRVEGLPSGMHYFVVRAEDTSGNQSGYSNEASKDIP